MLGFFALVGAGLYVMGHLENRPKRRIAPGE